MTKDIKHDYDSDLDILHVYSPEIKEGVKGCLVIGDFNINVGNNGKVVGIELEEASKNLNLDPKILSSPDSVELITRKTGDYLLLGIIVVKGEIKSSTNITTNASQTTMPIAC